MSRFDELLAQAYLELEAGNRDALADTICSLLSCMESADVDAVIDAVTK